MNDMTVYRMGSYIVHHGSEDEVDDMLDAMITNDMTVYQMGSYIVDHGSEDEVDDMLDAMIKYFRGRINLAQLRWILEELVEDCQYDESPEHDEVQRMFD